MTTDEPLDLTIQKMNRVMDEVEKLVGRDRRPERLAGEPIGPRLAPGRLLIGYTVHSGFP